MDKVIISATKDQDYDVKFDLDDKSMVEIVIENKQNKVTFSTSLKNLTQAVEQLKLLERTKEKK